MKQIYITLLFLAFGATVHAQLLTQSNFTLVTTPQVMASGTTTRLPVVFRATLSGLAPNTNYRYFINLALTSDFGTTNTGAGNPLFNNPAGSSLVYTTSASLSSASNYDSITTNGSGSYTGWFSVVNTANTRFTAGNYVYPTISLDSAGTKRGAVNSRFVATNDSIQVLTFSASAGANNGTGIRGTSFATAKNVILLYDNIAGTGDPISIAYAENFGVTIASIVSFYSTNVQAVAGAWGTIIPNTLPGGVKRIEQRSLVDNSLIGAHISNNGTWTTGNVNTVNPSGGTTAMVISATDAPLPVKLTAFRATQNKRNIVLNWATALEINTDYFQLERSIDGSNFYKIASQASKYTNGGEYTYTDTEVNSSVNYYRIKMVDKDASYSYTNVLKIVTNFNNGFEIKPNPVKDAAQLTFKNTSEISTIKMYHLSGKIISSTIIPANSTQTTINVNHLPAGQYLVEMLQGKERNTAILIKQ